MSTISLARPTASSVYYDLQYIFSEISTVQSGRQHRQMEAAQLAKKMTYTRNIQPHMYHRPVSSHNSL